MKIGLQSNTKCTMMKPSMKGLLLGALVKFTLLRYESNINAPCSPKLIVFSKTIFAILNFTAYTFEILVDTINTL